ncbi:MAG: hypothetical protein WB495_28115, partial [Xanthobacteraceae bacterium]
EKPRRHHALRLAMKRMASIILSQNSFIGNLGSARCARGEAPPFDRAGLRNFSKIAAGKSLKFNRSK